MLLHKFINISPTSNSAWSTLTRKSIHRTIVSTRSKFCCHFCRSISFLIHYFILFTFLLCLLSLQQGYSTPYSWWPLQIFLLQNLRHRRPKQHSPTKDKINHHCLHEKEHLLLHKFNIKVERVRKARKSNTIKEDQQHPESHEKKWNTRHWCQVHCRQGVHHGGVFYNCWTS